MSRHIVKIFNETVAENDILYHLGDWSFGGIQNIWNFRKQLRCKTIHLCLGNHDEHIRHNTVLPNCISATPYGDVFIDGQNIDPEYPNYVEATRLFTSVQDVLTIKHNKYIFFLSHYAHRIWLGSHRGHVHLFGHSHGGLDDKPWGKSMDCGIDSAKRILGEYRPFSIEEIIDIMDKREIKFIDNHNEKTNIK